MQIVTDQSFTMCWDFFPRRRLLTRLRDSWRWALAAPLAAIVLLGACGGGDDDDDAGDSGGSSSSGATGSDEKFVADICKGFATFGVALTKATADPNKLSDPKAITELFAKPFDQLAKDFAAAKPPRDLKDWHKDTSDSLNKAAAAIKKGDLAALESLDNDLPDPPKGAEERLSKIADKNKDCKEGNFNFNAD